MSTTPAAAAPASGTERSGLARAIPFLLVSVPVLLFLTGLIGRYLKSQSAAGPALPVLGEVPDFTFVERSGVPISRDDLKGRLWVADFIFTRCGGPCPMMSYQMNDLQKTIKRKVQDVRLVSFTLDPEYDTPEVLRDYADKFSAHPEKWLFLTGDRVKIQTLASQGLKLSAVEGQDRAIVHSTHFVLVDQNGRVRGYYNGTDVDALNKLREDLDKLIKEAAR
ncbi:MAG: SCO family protein [Planctomycetota bacterium]|nr:SCO family protein [Planctomycetota bacterium]